MKRKFESGASKRRRKQLDEASAKDFMPITSFLEQEYPLYPTNTALVDDNSEYSSDDNSISMHEHEDIDYGNIPVIHATGDPIYNQEAQQQQVDIDLTQMTITSVPDIGIIDKRNTSQMKSFLKITCFTFPKNIPRDADNHAFPFRLLTKALSNGETCTRDWLCWSIEKKSLYCVPCFIFNKIATNTSVLADELGWSIDRGWRKLKDRIPSHENSISHKNNYVEWKSANKAATVECSIENLLIAQLTTEANNWKKILERILSVILFLSERGLAFFGSSKRIEDPSNGNFLGIVELLSKYDPLLSEHVKLVRESQESGKRMQVHYLSTHIQNEFIDLCSSFVQTTILDEIRSAKYYAIIVDATPDCSHKEQTTMVVRYVKIVDSSKCSIEERFVLFDNFTKKSGKEIAARILAILESLNLNFQFCIGQAYDNGANMAGKYKGVQAVLLEQNSNCIFSSCGNHTLNLVGVDCAESCREAITYFGTVQQMYNLFSSSPQRWEILKQHLPVSLHSISKTRWSARIDGVKPVAHHLSSLRKALCELESINLTALARTELRSIEKYISKFEFILMSNIWIKLLTMIHQTNLVIETRNTTLDAERDNIQSLANDIQKIREQWNTILNESKLVADNIEISSEFTTGRKFPTQFDVEQYYRENVFFVIIDSIQSGLIRRFESLQLICTLFGFLWQFSRLSNEDLLFAAEKFQLQYNKEISKDLSEELIFLKRIYSTNFKMGCNPKELLQEILELGLSAMFPNTILALRIFVSLPASVTSGERTFNVLKQVKNYHRSTMGQERLRMLRKIFVLRYIEISTLY